MSNLSHPESGLGNAESPSSKDRSKDGVQGKFWKVNYHLKDDESFESVFNTLQSKVVPFCAKYIFSEEYGSKGKTRHIEGGFITREDRKRRSAIQSSFKFSDCQKSKKANWQAIINYCTKEGNTRITNETIKRPITYINRDDFYIYQEKIMSIISEEPDNRTIHWFFGPKCIGKTQLLKYLCGKHGANVITIRTEQHALAQVYKTHETVDIYCMNLTADQSKYQPHCIFSILESIKDEMFSASFGTECNGMCLMNTKHVIVMANEPPKFAHTEIDINRFIIYEIDSDTKDCDILCNEDLLEED